MLLNIVCCRGFWINIWHSFFRLACAPEHISRPHTLIINDHVKSTPEHRYSCCALTQSRVGLMFKATVYFFLLRERCIRRSRRSIWLCFGVFIHLRACQTFASDGSSRKSHLHSELIISGRVLNGKCYKTWKHTISSDERNNEAFRTNLVWKFSNAHSCK